LPRDNQYQVHLAAASCAVSRAQDVSLEHGFDESARCYCEFNVCGCQCVRL
jgi:hypothetical protein